MTIVFNRIGAGEAQVALTSLVIAGWTGRDLAAVQHHIDELAALGVKPPLSTPCYYTVTPELLTTAEDLAFLGGDSSGEVEFVLVSLEDGLWVGVGSDHTDRRVEAYSVSVSKQVCAKPIGPDLWRFDEVAGHWDDLVLRSYVVEGGRRSLYQEGPAARMLPPLDLAAGCPHSVAGRLPPGSALFCGTLAAIGGVRPARRFEMELHDPRLGRTLRHAYAARALPLAAE
jgi:hypothetical protein